MIEAVNNWKVRLVAPVLNSIGWDAVTARVEFLRCCGWYVTERKYDPVKMEVVIVMEKSPDVLSAAELRRVLGENL